MSEKSEKRYIGKSVLKKEHIKRLTGQGKYLDDIEIHGIKPYYVAFLRSTYPHAKIKKIDFSDAVKRRGVIGIFTGDDLKEYTLPYWMHLPTMKEFKRHPLAVVKVKYYGEPIAAVIAEDKYIA
ncbi:MAG: xanthine dehydrogenase family protein molybdopterin-binding subunit, partial [Sulfolobaceae archaeon]